MKVSLQASLVMIIPHFPNPILHRLGSPAEISLLSSSLLQVSQLYSTSLMNLAFANDQVNQDNATLKTILTLTSGGAVDSSRVAFAGTAVTDG